MRNQADGHCYSIIIAVTPQLKFTREESIESRFGEITCEYVDFTREKSIDQPPPMRTPNGKLPPGVKGPALTPSSKKLKGTAERDQLSLQPLVGHYTAPKPLGVEPYAQGISDVGHGLIHLFKHAPPADGIDGDEPVSTAARAEGADGTLIAILAVPAWMRPSDFLEFLGGWAVCLEGVRMIREAMTPNRSIVLLKFRDPRQAADFLVIFTGKEFTSLDAKETCHPIRIHHLVLHLVDQEPVTVPAFPPSIYTSLLPDVDREKLYELPSCPVCLERLDSSVTGLVTLPCAHTFDCECLRKWGDSRCPVCRVSHLLLSNVASSSAPRDGLTRLSKCKLCDSLEHNWICVVCGDVGCGRYAPGLGHARSHWEETGHAFAMELETQRVWDYKGDNYVHRLIQNRTDGKLVELPSLSSLSPSRSLAPPLADASATASTSTRTTRSSPPPQSDPSSGPSENDISKMSKIEDITLEYSYLLSSQLEAQRLHFEKRVRELEEYRERAVEAERAKEKAEIKVEKSASLAKALQASLASERALSSGLSTRITTLQRQTEQLSTEKQEKEGAVKELEETVRDLMIGMEMGKRVEELGGEGGSVSVAAGKKKGRR